MIDSTGLSFRSVIFFFSLLSSLTSSAQSEIHRNEPLTPNAQVNKVDHSNGYTMLSGSFSVLGEYTGGLVETNSATGLSTGMFPKVNGAVHTIVSDGAGGFYVGGYFTSVDTVKVTNIAHINADRTVDRTWKPTLDGAPTVLTVSGTTLYVGGYFNNISGTIRNYLAAFNTTTGALTNWNPNPNNQVDAITVSGSTVYLGGYFTTVSGMTRQRAAAVDASAGTVLAWNPNCNNVVLSIAVSGTNVFIGGFFTTVGGLPRQRLANVDPISGVARPTWITNIDNGGVLDLVVDSDRLYVGGSFFTIGGNTRNGIAAYAISTATLTPLNTGDAGSYIDDVEVSNGKLYVAGEFTSFAGTARTNAAAIDIATGNVHTWDPSPESSVITMIASGGNIIIGGYFYATQGTARNTFALINNATDELWPFTFDVNGGTINAIAVKDNILYIGGQFTAINKTIRRNLAALDLTSGQLLPWNPLVYGTSTTDPDAYVTTMEIRDNLLYIGGKFYFVNGTASANQRSGLAAVDLSSGIINAWNPIVGDGKTTDQIINTLDVSGNVVYVGGNFALLALSQNRNNLAAIDATTATILPWNPGSDGPINRIKVTSTTAYVAGGFRIVGGQARSYGIAAVNLSNNNATTWNPTFTGGVSDIALNTTDVYVGGYFSAVDNSFRPGLASFALANGALNAWTPDIGDNNDGSYVIYSLAANSGRLFVGGDMRSFGTEERSYYGEYELCPPDPVLTVNGNVLSTTAGGTLQWYKNDEPVTGATGTSYTADAYEYGVYYVTATSAGCIGQSATFEYLITDRESTSPELIRVYPNPVQTDLHIEGYHKSDAITFTIIDMMGRTVRRFTSHNFQETLSLRDVESGPYVLIINNGKETVSRKIVKLK